MGMTRVSLAEAQGQLGTLLDQVEAGDTVTITRHGRAIARLTAIRNAPRKPVDLDALRALTAGLPLQGESAVSLVRAMRDGSRY